MTQLLEWNAPPGNLKLVQPTCLAAMSSCKDHAILCQSVVSEVVLHKQRQATASRAHGGTVYCKASSMDTQEELLAHDAAVEAILDDEGTFDK